MLDIILCCFDFFSCKDDEQKRKRKRIEAEEKQEAKKSVPDDKPAAMGTVSDAKSAAVETVPDEKPAAEKSIPDGKPVTKETVPDGIKGKDNLSLDPGTIAANVSSNLKILSQLMCKTK